ncbi:hypothetical protein [Arenibacterium halophilum]|uniref:Uncharacterized protein n=1 Tax=Arenibacterium halophilum TaxID=2583821 RepID=A0ABY2X9A4_9RHOB|nr:hypothetical protein [Arenibacterium halophilum]TMV12962.1 hypothetical protein FGK64_09210 [Arenibacterium halophilum]
MRVFKASICAAFGLVFAAGVAHAEMSVKLGAPWGGKKVPNGQQCTLHGGKGATPPMTVSGLPAGTAGIVVEYDDKSYAPLATKGGHGTLIYPASGASAKLPAVPGLTDKLPGGVRVVKRSRGKGQYASKGYLPPCSGGQGNKYTATLKAVNGQGKVLEKTTIVIGTY